MKLSDEFDIGGMLSHYNALVQGIDWLYSAMKGRRKTGLIVTGMFDSIFMNLIFVSG